MDEDDKLNNEETSNEEIIGILSDMLHTSDMLHGAIFSFLGYYNLTN